MIDLIKEKLENDNDIKILNILYLYHELANDKDILDYVDYDYIDEYIKDIEEHFNIKIDYFPKISYNIIEMVVKSGLIEYRGDGTNSVKISNYGIDKLKDIYQIDNSLILSSIIININININNELNSLSNKDREFFISLFNEFYKNKDKKTFSDNLVEFSKSVGSNTFANILTSILTNPNIINNFISL